MAVDAFIPEALLAAPALQSWWASVDTETQHTVHAQVSDLAFYLLDSPVSESVATITSIRPILERFLSEDSRDVLSLGFVDTLRRNAASKCSNPAALREALGP